MAELRRASQASEDSQTAADFIREQLHLEAEAREALPYQFDTCTRPLGAIRQSLFSCLTCNPPPPDSSAPYTAAGVCYSCSISCHGEHTLVELFGKRNFVCDCGTSRLPETAPCQLQINSKTGLKGGVTGEEPAQGNRYNQNFRNRFCGCGEEYDPNQEKGTMFQCLGLGYAEDGGCGEDWWHPECIIGMSREDYKRYVEEEKARKTEISPKKETENVKRESNTEPTGEQSRDQAVTDEPRAAIEEEEDDDTPLPPGFPDEDDFDHFLCYKCVERHPWIKRYAGAPGFLPPVFHRPSTGSPADLGPSSAPSEPTSVDSKKRKAEDDAPEETSPSLLSATPAVKRQKSVHPSTTLPPVPESSDIPCRCDVLPPAPSAPLSLFLKADFRTHICHCPSCFPLLKPHPQLLEEEETYEPPVSEDGDATNGSASIGTGSIYDRGEAAFSSMDRVRAMQGAMAYAHLKDSLKAFLQPFAESKTAVGAEDIKAYFEKLRGDEQGIREAKGGAEAGRKGDGEGGGGEGDNRREQSGY
ncbi:putative metaphase-anaphase transition protein [Westerdykella ornata]|uniref:Putative metaphase-anaphase transition protein n=1 Tax=Westerdykella ornata TaxID=318751 RepID=A0A6A6JGT9_WESOR|nr:putative metaphase-anaphase transition protein [Westerdykella ornata]KAF2274846.1 putative metaphase-anaphase transition protein [Westerdykella ornata]